MLAGTYRPRAVSPILADGPENYRSLDTCIRAIMIPELIAHMMTFDFARLFCMGYWGHHAWPGEM